MKFSRESEVGDIVIEYLKDLRQDVYCEVETGLGRIDIVAVSESGLITSVELKVRLSFDVLGQAIDRSGYAHRSIAAFPMPRDSCSYKRRVLRSVSETGIGIWNVKSGSVEELFAPRLNRRPVTKHILDNLHDEQRDQQAGVANGYWSPFQQTTRSLIRYVADHPGCSLKEAMTQIKHHYASHSSAYSSMCRWINTGVIEQVERRGDGLYLRRQK